MADCPPVSAAHGSVSPTLLWRVPLALALADASLVICDPALRASAASIVQQRASVDLPFSSAPTASPASTAAPAPSVSTSRVPNRPVGTGVWAELPPAVLSALPPRQPLAPGVS